MTVAATDGAERGTLDELAAIEAIKQLKARYFRHIDTKDWSAWAEAFTDDVVYYDDPTPFPSTTEPVRAGKDAFVGFVREALDPCMTVHQGHTPEIEILDDRSARGIWALHVVTRADGNDRVAYGHYHERYEKGADGRWRIKELRITRIHSVGQLPGAFHSEVKY